MNEQYAPQLPVESTPVKTTIDQYRNLTRRRTSGASLTFQPIARSLFGSVGFVSIREG